MRIGVDLGGTKTEIIALAEDGRELARFRRPTPRDDYEANIRQIADLVATVETQFGRADSVGIGTPGSCLPATGCMKNCNSVWLNDRPLPADLSRALDREIVLANDADCFALSEAVDGAGAGARVVFGVILGTGVGGGIVVDGALLAGPNGLAGEWGHSPQPPLEGAPRELLDRRAALGDRACFCGRRNCVETWLSGPALLQTWRQLGGAMDAALPDIESAARSGDEGARAALDLHAWHLSAALGIVINLLDPQCIVLGGGVSNLDSLVGAVTSRWTGFVAANELNTKLARAEHGDSGGVRGAAWLGMARPSQARGGALLGE